MLQFLMIYCASIITSSSAQSCPCNTAYECTTFSAFGSCQVYSYKGAFGQNTRFEGDSISCSGSFSCQSMQYIISQTDVFCRGRDSCSNTSIQSMGNDIQSMADIHCGGSSSCAFSDIILRSNTQLLCTGSFSCAYTNINLYDNETEYFIYARGSLSMYQSTIDTLTGADNQINIDLEASLSGFGAQLICRESNTCNINCQSNDGCFMFYINCIGICNINHFTQNTIHPINNTASLNYSLIAFIPKRFESHDTIAHNDALCINDMWNFDDTQEHEHGAAIMVDVDSEGPICCRAMRSCSNVTAFEYQSNTNNDLICDGYRSCLNTIVNSNYGSVYCEALSACYGASIRDTKTVYCTGGWSCFESTIINANYIVCDGHVSCKLSTIISGGSGDELHIYALSRAAVRDAKVYCNRSDTCFIHCIGFDACSNTELICVHNCNVSCDGAQASCPLLTNIDPLTTETTQVTSHLSSTQEETTDAAQLTSTQEATTNAAQLTSNSSWNPTEETLAASWNTTKTTHYSPDPSLTQEEETTDTTHHAFTSQHVTKTSHHSPSAYLYSSTNANTNGVITEQNSAEVETDPWMIGIIGIICAVASVSILSICFVIWYKCFYKNKIKADVDENRVHEVQTITQDAPQAAVKEKRMRKVQPAAVPNAQIKQYTDEGADEREGEEGQNENVTQYVTEYTTCMQCGDRTKQKLSELDGLLVCMTCIRLNRYDKENQNVDDSEDLYENENEDEEIIKGITIDMETTRGDTRL